MVSIGLLSCNIYCNFTNYGSALQTYALYNILNKVSDKITIKLIDYCPKVLERIDPLNPVQHMWDTGDAIIKDCIASLPAIKINYNKFMNFYNTKFIKTLKTTSENFESVMHSENISYYVCGSDTIFCTDEFGFDDGYYANYPCMKKHSIACAASFGDCKFDESSDNLKKLLNNFNFLGIRETQYLPLVRNLTNIPASRIIDPTILVDFEILNSLATEKLIEEKYILLYSRRNNPEMYQKARDKAQKLGCKLIEISLRASHAADHPVFYEAGVEEFMSLVKYSEEVITNSYHGMIMAMRFNKPLTAYAREECNIKILELFELLLPNSIFKNGETIYWDRRHFSEDTLAKLKKNTLAKIKNEVLKMVNIDEHC